MRTETEKVIINNNKLRTYDHFFNDFYFGIEN